MDVAAWLYGLGLEQYAQLFRDNEIDAEVVPKRFEREGVAPHEPVGRPPRQQAPFVLT